MAGNTTPDVTSGSLVARVLEHVRSEEGRKKLRYAGVSVVFVPVGQVIIQVLGQLVFDRNYTLASLVNAALLTPPNFFANKRFVWRNASRDNLRTQVLVFWVAAMLGVSFATGLTWVVEQWAHERGALVEAGAVLVAQMVGFGLVWVGRFLVLDRWLFKVTHHGQEPTADELARLDSDLPI